MAKKENRVLIVVILVIALVSLLISVFNPVLSRSEFRASFILSNTPGLGDRPGEIFFGAITEENSATRKILIENYFDEDILVNIKSRGEISDNLIVSENNFLLSGRESREVSFTVFPDGLEKYKEYEGKIIIITKKT